jgi:hypothetical protein
VGEFIGGVAQQGASEPSAADVWIDVGDVQLVHCVGSPALASGPKPANRTRSASMTSAQPWRMGEQLEMCGHAASVEPVWLDGRDRAVLGDVGSNRRWSVIEDHDVELPDAFGVGEEVDRHDRPFGEREVEHHPG